MTADANAEAIRALDDDALNKLLRRLLGLPVFEYYGLDLYENVETGRRIHTDDMSASDKANFVFDFNALLAIAARKDGPGFNGPVAWLGEDGRARLAYLWAKRYYPHMPDHQARMAHLDLAELVERGPRPLAEDCAIALSVKETE